MTGATSYGDVNIVPHHLIRFKYTPVVDIRLDKGKYMEYNNSIDIKPSESVILRVALSTTFDYSFNVNDLNIYVVCRAVRSNDTVFVINTFDVDEDGNVMIRLDSDMTNRLSPSVKHYGLFFLIEDTSNDTKIEKSVKLTVHKSHIG